MSTIYFPTSCALTSLRAQGWVDQDEEGIPSYQDIVGAHDDEDEEFDEKADQFESAYNFRFEVCVALETSFKLTIAITLNQAYQACVPCFASMKSLQVCCLVFTVPTQCVYSVHRFLMTCLMLSCCCISMHAVRIKLSKDHQAVILYLRT